MNMKMPTTKLRHLNPNLAQDNCILVPRMAMPMTLRKAGVRAFTPWFNSPTDSCAQLPSAQGYPLPGTTKVRGRSSQWTGTGLAGIAHIVPMTVGANSDLTTGGRHVRCGEKASGAINDFHIASNWSHVGMGRGKGSPVRAVYASPRRVMYSNNTRKPDRGAPNSKRSPIG